MVDRQVERENCLDAQLLFKNTKDLSETSLMLNAMLVEQGSEVVMSESHTGEAAENVQRGAADFPQRPVPYFPIFASVFAGAVLGGGILGGAVALVSSNAFASCLSFVFGGTMGGITGGAIARKK